MVHLKNGQSASYINNNLVKSDTFIAFVKNGFSRSMVQIFKISDLENDSLHSDLIQSQNVEWESKDKECTHINYLFINFKWYLLVGYIGEFEIYNEDGSKRYFSSATAPVGIN